MGTDGIFQGHPREAVCRLRLSELDSYAIRFGRCVGCGQRHSTHASCTAPSTRMDGPDMNPGNPDAAAFADAKDGL